MPCFQVSRDRQAGGAVSRPNQITVRAESVRLL